MIAKRHKFNSAREWLDGKIAQVTSEQDFQALISILNSVIDKVDNDEIQDIFESEMDKDGFFDNLNVAEPTTIDFFKDELAANADRTLSEVVDRFSELKEEYFEKYVQARKALFDNRGEVGDVMLNIDGELHRLKSVHAADLDVKLCELMASE